MKRYDSYKDSGVEWIGEIPSHWGRKRLKHISESVNGYSFKSNDFDREYDVPVIRIGDVGESIDFTNCVKVKSHFLEDKSEFLVKKNDILIGLTGGTIGKSGRYNYDSPSLLNQRVGLLRNKESVLNGLLHHYVNSEVFIRYIFFDCYGGGQDNISMNDILNMVFPYPPLSEQQQIVSFLDTKTSLIDSLIEKTQRKIELLKEKRTSLINEVVTKGLNPNVEMKDSGVEWIGEIPSHWGRLPLKQFGDVTLGKMLTSEDKGGYHLKPYLRSKNIQVERVDISDMKEMWFSDSEVEKLKLEKGDLLFNEGGDVGRTCIWLNEIDECYIQNSVNRVRFENDDERYFLHLSILYHSVGYYDSLVNRVSIPHLTKEKLESVTFLRPPLSEQQQIVEYLDEQTQLIDNTVSIEKKRIELLKEYRQSLISEVVTGKLKVTN